MLYSFHQAQESPFKLFSAPSRLLSSSVGRGDVSGIEVHSIAREVEQDVHGPEQEAEIWSTDQAFGHLHMQLRADICHRCSVIGPAPPEASLSPP